MFKNLLLRTALALSLTNISISPTYSTAPTTDEQESWISTLTPDQKDELQKKGIIEELRSITTQEKREKLLELCKFIMYKSDGAKRKNHTAANVVLYDLKGKSIAYLDMLVSNLQYFVTDDTDTVKASKLLSALSYISANNFQRITDNLKIFLDEKKDIIQERLRISLVSYIIGNLINETSDSWEKLITAMNDFITESTTEQDALDILHKLKEVSTNCRSAGDDIVNRIKKGTHKSTGELRGCSSSRISSFADKVCHISAETIDTLIQKLPDDKKLSDDESCHNTILTITNALPKPARAKKR